MNRRRTFEVYIIAIAVLGSAFCTGRAAHAQLLPDLTGPLRDLPTETLREQRLKELAERRARQAAAEAEETAEDVAGTATEVADGLDESVTGAAGAVVGTATGVLRAFVPAVDPAGADIEAGVIVVLLPTGAAADLEAAGYTIVSTRSLPSLGRTMATLRVPAGRDPAADVDALRQAYPAAAVDYNHLYRWDAAPTTPVAPSSAAEPAADATAPDARVRIGIIDSAVQATHRALAGVDVVPADFIGHEGERLETHGTAVASLVARSAKNEVVVYSASVFFQVPGYAPGATTESLVAALDWLAGQQVDVINMSLSGPGNALLEAAVAAVLEQGHTIVAAVGNEGPSSPPLYPAAYDGVIGVTAVDRDRRVFREANRGDYVDFAALGVDVKVADCSTGSYRLASGTSMAAPHVAVVAARLLRHAGVDGTTLASWLSSGAEDLGRKGFDPVYGHGLVTELPEAVSVER